MPVQTPVVIIGAGPAGLTLSHLLHLRGVESVVIESRSREDVENTVRAGILEQGTMNLMRETGVGDRMDREADIDEGIDISIEGKRTRIALTELTGHNVAVYPQHEYLKDFIARRLADDGTILFETTVDDVTGTDDDSVPSQVRYTTADGTQETITCDYVVAADGSKSPYRARVVEATGGARSRHEYPYAWFGILVDGPKTQKELIYATHPEGFALISTRTDDIQRYYLQCDPNDDPENWSDDRIWEQLHLRVDSEDLQVAEGRIFDKSVLRFRSAVTEPMQHGRLFLAGDAAHTVPPTGAKGLNLAVADVAVLAPALARAVKDKDERLLADYSSIALPRIWRAQHFSYWMSTMLHAAPGETRFEANRRVAELDAVLRSEAGRRYHAEQYVGADLPVFD
ncbi:4-hydroxybenzoate 3-monooxygenase [Corynebacterium frankenforstense]|uniref:4-hydroxybenzoate 3-monooxygenase n=1 Tax=Corynebacterium frankenforstense TaxID=1230998 RepID=UPI0025508BD5|nr:4-hydroxybenzoate 3-monooxygenase [Corynebacterium frankenforstense]MDK6259369.1 4-hydroxybenzoate 3-monooxygenase [Corynebacterium frankenforstense]